MSEGKEKDGSRKRKWEAGKICNECGQDMATGAFDPETVRGTEEATALVDDSLCLYGTDSSMPDEDRRPENKITCFTVYDKEGHMCAFDGGMIEQNKSLYIAGFLKPIYAEDSSKEGGVAVVECGPIHEWWISGFDSGENVIIAVSTGLGEYILMQPSPEYRSFMEIPYKKALLTKRAVEFLTSEVNPTYEDLTSRLIEEPVPPGMAPLTEDDVERYAQFLTEQVTGLDDDLTMIRTSAMRTFIQLHGTKIGVVKKRFKQKKVVSMLTKATVTSLVATVFRGALWKNQKYFEFVPMKKNEDLVDEYILKFRSHEEVYCNVEFMTADKSAASVNHSLVSVGDFVAVPNNPDSPKETGIFQIKKLYRSRLSGPVFHGVELVRGSETILGEASDSRELFYVDRCEDQPLEKILGTVAIKVLDSSGKLDWAKFQRPKVTPYMGLFVRNIYDSEGKEFRQWTPTERCPCVNRPGLSLAGRHHENGELLYDAVVKDGVEYKPGCAILVDANAVKLDGQTEVQDLNRQRTPDPLIYPEFWRKRTATLRGPATPLKVCRVLKITQGFKDVHFHVKKFYRPEDTHLVNSVHEELLDTHLLYWSEETATISLCNVRGLCTVHISCFDSAESVFDVEFYCYKTYIALEKRFVALWPMQADRKESSGSSPEARPLRCLNPFSGCGGLAKGLTQSGAARIDWGVEIDEMTAASFAANFPEAAVFHEDCNLMLNDILDGKDISKDGRQYPKLGEVEMICGGPPCQGFSILNRFPKSDKAVYEKSLLLTFLSFCDYYRPKVCVMENVQGLCSCSGSTFFKYTLSTFVTMGYQVSFDVLQAGSYGVPQSRRRLIIVAVAPGIQLPRQPLPTHSFNIHCTQDGHQGRDSAPLRTITIADAMGDLPPIKSGIGQEMMLYHTDDISRYQKEMRDNNDVLRDHLTKQLSPINEARVNLLPKTLGADWRDLPNISITLRDATKIKPLRYTHENGRTSIKGVCPCVVGLRCNPASRQFQTIIPWHLPHTASRHNHWAGVFGRLNNDDVLATVITNPDPSSKQGRVIHPKQARIISIRECARGMGHRDTFYTFGTILQRYKQVGNSVPPPLARAVGLEIKKSLNKLMEGPR